MEQAASNHKILKTLYLLLLCQMQKMKTYSRGGRPLPKIGRLPDKGRAKVDTHVLWDQLQRFGTVLSNLPMNFMSGLCFCWSNDCTIELHSIKYTVSLIELLFT